MRELDGDLAIALGGDQGFFMKLAEFYTDGVPVVTVAAHSTCSNDSRTFIEAGITLR